MVASCFYIFAASLIFLVNVKAFAVDPYWKAPIKLTVRGFHVPSIKVQLQAKTTTGFSELAKTSVKEAFSSKELK